MEAHHSFNEIEALLNTVSHKLLVQTLLEKAAESQEKTSMLITLLASLFHCPSNDEKNNNKELQQNQKSLQPTETPFSWVKHQPNSAPGSVMIPILRKYPLTPRRRRSGLGRSRDETQIFRRSKHNSKHMLRRRSSGDVNQVHRIRGKKTGTLLEILEDPILSSGFRSFLASKYCEENLDFHKEVEQYKKTFQSTLPRNEALLLARYIYKNYISDDAVQQVNIAGTLRRSLEMKIESITIYDLTLDLFNSAQLEVKNLLAVQWFPAFKEDDIFIDCFRKYLEVQDICSSQILSLPEIPSLDYSDWNILMTNSRKVRFQPGEYITKHDQINPQLYITDCGILRFEKIPTTTKETESSEQRPPIVISRFTGKGFLFGHYTVFSSNLAAPIQVVAETEVRLIQLNVPFILSYLRSNVALAFRFFAAIGGKITEFTKYCFSNIRQTDLCLVELPSPSSGKHKAHEMSDIFPDLSGEIVLHECEASCQIMIGVGREKCEIIVTSANLYWHCSVVGQVVKRSLELRKVTKHFIDHQSTVHVCRNKKDIQFKFRTPSDAIAFNDVLMSLTDFYFDPEEDIKRDDYVSKIIKARPYKTSSTLDLVSTFPDCFTKVKYSRGDVIVQQGILYSALPMILQGACRLERENYEKKFVYFNLETVGEDIHGESGLFLNRHAGASLVAIEDNVETLWIRCDLLTRVLKEQRSTEAVFFYFHICSCVGNHLIQLLNSLY